MVAAIVITASQRRVGAADWRVDALQLPALELRDRLLERLPLLVAARLGPQPLVRPYGEIEGEGIVLRAGDAGGVVGQCGARQLVGGKTLGHLLPALHARARIGLREGPEMPGAAISRVGALRALGELADDV